MFTPGSVFSFTVLRQTALGAAATGKVAADFDIACWLDGVLQTLSPTPTVTELTTEGDARAYRVTLTLPSTTGHLQIAVLPVSGSTDIIIDGQLVGSLESYTMDGLAGLLLTAQGVPAVQSAADGDLGQVVEDDSFQSEVLTFPLGKLTPFGLGFADLATATITAQAKAEPADATPATLVVTPVNLAGAGTLRIGWDAWPGGIMDLGASEQSKRVYIDVQAEFAGPTRYITGLRYQLEIVWQRNTNT